MQRSSLWVGSQLLITPFWCQYVSGPRTSVPGIVVADSCFPGRWVYDHSFFVLHSSGFLLPRQLIPITEVSAELITDILGHCLHVSNFSVCLSQRMTCLQFTGSILIALRCKIAFALLNSCKILRPGTFSSVIPRYSSLPTVLPQILPAASQSIPFPPPKNVIAPAQEHF